MNPRSFSKKTAYTAIAVLCIGIAVASTAIAASQGAPRGVNTMADSVSGTATVSLNQVQAIAVAEAERAGQAVPANIEAVTSSARTALETMDPNLTMPARAATPAEAEALEDPAYLVAMTGSFTLHAARVPVGHPAPSGAVLEIVVDARTGFVEGRHIGSEISGDLSAVGNVVTLG